MRFRRRIHSNVGASNTSVIFSSAKALKLSPPPVNTDE
jgi:hypothetical protein